MSTITIDDSEGGTPVSVWLAGALYDLGYRLRSPLEVL